MKSNRNTKKRGYSLLETAIAMALIALVFSMAVSTVLMATAVRTRSQHARFFSAEVSGLLSCYQIGGESTFAGYAERYLQKEIALTDGHAALYYGSDYAPAEQPDEAAFTLTIDLTEGFFASVTDRDGKSVYRMPAVYVSRFDGSGGGA